MTKTKQDKNIVAILSKPRIATEHGLTGGRKNFTISLL